MQASANPRGGNFKNFKRIGKMNNSASMMKTQDQREVQDSRNHPPILFKPHVSEQWRKTLHSNLPQFFRRRKAQTS